jgi:hypothetical protein
MARAALEAPMQRKVTLEILGMREIRELPFRELSLVVPEKLLQRGIASHYASVAVDERHADHGAFEHDTDFGLAPA